MGYVFFSLSPCTSASTAKRFRGFSLTNGDVLAITFLAQWHPLIQPQRGDLRPEYNGGPVKGESFF